MACSPSTQQEWEWATVLEQVRDLDDARALYTMFIHSAELYADELPAYALITEAAILSHRSFAGFLMRHLGSTDQWAYTTLYSSSEDATAEQIESLVERCRDAGVELHVREEAPTPWRVVLGQLANDADAAAFDVLAAHYTANSWWIDLEVDLVRPVASSTATDEQVEDLIARCRRAGVVLRQNR